MINYTITRTQETTTITLPEGTTKYHNQINNTSYYTNKAEQRIRTHQRSWKTIATVYLDNITLNTETITSETVFTFHLKNTTNNTSIDIPVNNKLADFQTNITNKLNPKHFYIVDLDNTSRFQTHFLDFINTVLIELNTNSGVLNELIEDTPVEEPTTPDTEQGLQSAIPHTVNGQITNTETDEIYTPVIISKKVQQGQNTTTANYVLLWKDKQDNTIIPAELDGRVQFLSGLTVTAEYNEETKDQTYYTPQPANSTIFLISFPIETTDLLEHTATITFTDPENSENTCTITETTGE